MFNPLRLLDWLFDLLFDNAPAIEQWWIKQSTISVWVAVPLVFLWLIGVVYTWCYPEQLIRSSVFPIIIVIGVVFLAIAVIRSHSSVTYHLYLRCKLHEDQVKDKDDCHDV